MQKGARQERASTTQLSRGERFDRVNMGIRKLRELNDGQIRCLNINLRFAERLRRGGSGRISQSEAEPIEANPNYNRVWVFETLAGLGDPLGKRVAELFDFAESQGPEKTITIERLVFSEAQLDLRILLRSISEREYNDYLDGNLRKKIKRWSEFHKARRKLRMAAEAKAETAIRKKDYGTALFLAGLFEAYEASTGYARSRAASAKAMKRRIGGLIMEEFNSLAKKEKLQVTAENRQKMLEEFSPSLIRFTRLRNDLYRNFEAFGRGDELGMDRFIATTLRGMTNEEFDLSKDLKYVSENLTKLVEWEPFKGDMGLSRERLINALECLAEQNKRDNSPGIAEIIKRINEVLEAG